MKNCRADHHVRDHRLLESFSEAMQGDVLAGYRRGLEPVRSVEGPPLALASKTRPNHLISALKGTKIDENGFQLEHFGPSRRLRAGRAVFESKTWPGGNSSYLSQACGIWSAFKYLDIRS